jgi:hypothetical protein
VLLEPTVAEIEAHVGAAGWDQRPTLFALVRAAQFAADDPQTAARLRIDVADGDALTPVEQEELPDEPLDEVLAGIAWPPAITGCVLSQEIVVLPPAAEDDVPDTGTATGADIERAAAHPQRREARLVVGVLRDGTSAVLLRLRPVPDSDNSDAAVDDPDGELLTGPDLAPNLVTALLATFDD